MIKNDLLMEAYNAVLNINESIVESINSESEQLYPVALHTDGLSLVIEFLGLQIWNDNEDEREFNEEKNEYEPLEPFIIKTIDEQLELIKKIKL